MTITNAGLNEVRDLLAGTGTIPSHIAVGSNNTAPAIGDTTLAGEVTREAFSSTDVTTDYRLSMEMTLDSTEGNGKSLNEIGVFNSGAGGDMFSRVTHAAITKNDSVEVQYTVIYEIGRL